MEFCFYHMEKKLRVKFFGESFVIHKLKIDDELITKFNNVALQLKTPLNEALLDIDFFRVLNIKGYESINDLISLTSVGLINNSKGQIEISLGRKHGSVQSDEKLLQRHSLIVQKLKKKLAIRDIAEIANCSTTTIIKVKKVMAIRQLL
jgi:hypothetical protein